MVFGVCNLERKYLNECMPFCGVRQCVGPSEQECQWTKCGSDVFASAYCVL